MTFVLEDISNLIRNTNEPFPQLERRRILVLLNIKLVNSVPVKTDIRIFKVC